ncbi:cornifelin homolog [Diadema setosum]|uniref:cornifelin homolog n=1 Tax=Diadema setosum TaxID=31175 RepID=UPI003B3BE5BB
MQKYQEQPPNYGDPNQPVMVQPAPILAPGQTVIQVTSQTMNPLMPRGVPRPWSTDLFACCDDMTICLCATFLPCYDCVLATDMNESCCVPFCIPGAPIAMRAQIRARHNIEGNLMSDCAAMMCCGPCTMCQLGREVQGIKAGKYVP